jgi:hypothetical protein
MLITFGVALDNADYDTQAIPDTSTYITFHFSDLKFIITF